MKLQPQFSGPIEGYVVNFLNQNYWKVARLMEFDDALQEARIVFVTLIARIEKREKNPLKEQIEITEPAHFMALFKTSWTRHFITLSNKASNLNSMLLQTDMEFTSHEDDITQSVFDTMAGDLENDGIIDCIISEAPEDVRQVMSLLLNTPTEILERAQAAFGESKRTDFAYSNKFLCAMLGKDPTKIDLVKKIKAHFE